MMVVLTQCPTCQICFMLLDNYLVPLAEKNDLNKAIYIKVFDYLQ